MIPIFSRWTQAIEQRGYQHGLVEGQRMAQERAMDERTELQHSMMQAQIGTPLIRIPNEWDNPVIGFGHCIEQVGHSCVLVIHDYVSNTQMMGGGVCFDFSEQKLDVLLRLDPFEAWAFLAHNNVGYENYQKTKTGQRDSADDILKKLRYNGFFERWDEFKREQR